MLIYKDVLSGDELFSDSYPIKLVNDLFYEVEGKTIKESADIDEALITEASLQSIPDEAVHAEELNSFLIENHIDLNTQDIEI